MKCPYCNSEMKKGRILGPRGVYWVKEERDPFFIRKSKGDVVIVGNWGLSPNENSYLCRSCNRIMIELTPPSGKSC